MHLYAACTPSMWKEEERKCNNNKKGADERVWNTNKKKRKNKKRKTNQNRIKKKERKGEQEKKCELRNVPHYIQEHSGQGRAHNAVLGPNYIDAHGSSAFSYTHIW